MASIEFDHITKRYEDGFTAVEDMSLRLGDGELMTLLGPSGSGKSTVLRMLAGLEHITDGILRIGSDVVNEWAVKDRNIATVSQKSVLYPGMTVRQNIGVGLRDADVSRGETDRIVAEAVGLLDLEGQVDWTPERLSGGQRQLVLMGRAIVRRPSVLLVDEPLATLDARLRVATRSEIAWIQQRVGVTTLYATRDQAQGLTLGDRVAVMRAGSVQQVGPPSQIYDHPENLFVAGFIGAPPMNFLPGHVQGETLSFPLAAVRLPDRLRRALHPHLDASPQPLIVGIRPEHFRDAKLVDDRSDGYTFTTAIDRLESLGDECYAHFTVASDRVTSAVLKELPRHNGTGKARLLHHAVPVVARLGRLSRIREGQLAELWFDGTQLHLFDDKSGRNLLADAGAGPPSQPPSAG